MPYGFVKHVALFLVRKWARCPLQLALKAASLPAPQTSAHLEFDREEFGPRKRIVFVDQA
jgi:hypothetical protein